MRILSDNPVRTRDEDLFALKESSLELGDLISSIEDPPATIGLFGGWGTGKTSMLALLQQDLEARPDFRTLWFDAWRFRHRSEVWPALVQSVLTNLADNSPGSQIKSKLIDLGRVATRVFLGGALQGLTHGLVTAGQIGQFMDNYAELQNERNSKLSSFAEEFDMLVGEALGNRRLVILVDDLDRCEPEAALEILEGIKLFLASRNCIFVIALDIDAIRQALKFLDRYSEEYRTYYLEKHIQLVRYVPDPPGELLRRGLSELSGLEFDDSVWNLVQAAASGNPRRAKRFVNLLLLSSRSGAAPDDLVTLARLMVFRVQFPLFFAELTRDHALWRDLETYLSQPASRGDHADAIADRHGWDVQRVDRLERLLENEHRLAEFLMSTGPNARTFYPAAPLPEAIGDLMVRAWRYGPTHHDLAAQA